MRPGHRLRNSFAFAIGTARPYRDLALEHAVLDPSPMGIDRRRAPRIRATGEVEFSVDDIQRRGWLRDVSVHGVRLSGLRIPPPGTRIAMRIPVPCHVLRLSGTVVWKGGPERTAAVELDPMTKAQQLALNSALLEHEGPPKRDSQPVLLMVDDPDEQRAIGRELIDRGYRVISRSTPLDALQRLEEDSDEVCAAVISAGLPNGGGLDVLNFLAEERPSVRRAVMVPEPNWNTARMLEPDCVLTAPYHRGDIAPLFAQRERVAG